MDSSDEAPDEDDRQAAASLEKIGEEGPVEERSSDGHMDAPKQEVPVFFRLDVTLKERLRGLAKRERRSMKEQLNHIIEQATHDNDDAPPAAGGGLMVV